MPVSLPKGANVSLSKQAPGLKDIVIGLGWDARATAGGPDLDASLFLLKDDGKVRSDADFVFYNNRRSPDGSVEHLGDDLAGAGDDEQQIRVDLGSVPPEVAKLSVAVTIHEAEGRNQDFGMVKNAYVRVVDGSNGGEVARYELSEDASTETAMILGEVYRRGGEWKFRAVGQGYAGGLGPLASNYGVDVSTQESATPPSESPNPPETAHRKPRSIVPVPETFDMEMVKRFLEKEGYNYLTDKDGDFQLRFTEESGFSRVAYLNAEGEQNEIYVLQSAHASLRIFERDWEKALTLCNDWNRDKRWPKAFLCARPSDPDTVTRLGTEHQIYCAEGIHQELLDELTATFIGTSYRFWETVHQELGHA